LCLTPTVRPGQEALLLESDFVVVPVPVPALEAVSVFVVLPDESPDDDPALSPDPDEPEEALAEPLRLSVL